jgi:hypothetical protein
MPVHQTKIKQSTIFFNRRDVNVCLFSPAGASRPGTMIARAPGPGPAADQTSRGAPRSPRIATGPLGWSHAPTLPETRLLVKLVGGQGPLVEVSNLDN